MVASENDSGLRTRVIELFKEQGIVDAVEISKDLTMALTKENSSPRPETTVIQEYVNDVTQKEVKGLMKTATVEERAELLARVMHTLSMHPSLAPPDVKGKGKQKKLENQSKHDPFDQNELYADPDGPVWMRTQLANLFDILLGPLVWDTEVPSAVETIISHTLSCLHSGHVWETPITPALVNESEEKFRENSLRYHKMQVLIMSLWYELPKYDSLRWYWNTKTPDEASPDEKRDASLVASLIGPDTEHMCVPGFEYKHGEHPAAVEDYSKGGATRQGQFKTCDVRSSLD
ncbi:hypothetical protein HDU93_004408 [Gonapodya sp. JEL0774]|nr:hypothetical protein HDU93_004408 [Gonapodya sp. JEL0774]